MSNEQQRRHKGNRGGGNRDNGPDARSILNKVKIKRSDDEGLEPEIFSETAEAMAKMIAENGRPPKPTQIRNFFDEVVMWEERARQDENRFPEYLPFIRMLNAKAAYAKGRGHVTENFVNMIAHCLKQVDDVDSLRNFKLFFEAFLGFYKLHGPKG